MKKSSNSPTPDKEVLREKEKVRKENAGKFFYDLAKITFTVIAIGRISNIFSETSNITNSKLLTFGLILTGMFSLGQFYSFVFFKKTL